jgi:hypothetical protein
VQLHVHLHERLLHVLDVRGRILYEPFAMTQVRAQLGDSLAWTEAAPQQPVRMELLQHWASFTSLLRPGTCLTSRAFTRRTSNRRASRISKTGIQYTPVDSMPPW